MKIIELLTINASLLNVLSRNNIKPKDVEFIELYRIAKDMESDGLKKSYIVQHLADKFGLPVRGVYSIIERFDKDIVL